MLYSVGAAIHIERNLNVLFDYKGRDYRNLIIRENDSETPLADEHFNTFHIGLEQKIEGLNADTYLRCGFHRNKYLSENTKQDYKRTLCSSLGFGIESDVIEFGIGTRMEFFGNWKRYEINNEYILPVSGMFFSIASEFKIFF